VRGVLVSAGMGNIPAGLGSATRAHPASSVFGAPQEVQTCVEPPSLGPFEVIGVSSLTCFIRSLVVSPRDGG
jgi:hypothetical protein